jgi:hypothetical protein
MARKRHDGKPVTSDSRRGSRHDGGSHPSFPIDGRSAATSGRPSVFRSSAGFLPTPSFANISRSFNGMAQTVKSLASETVGCQNQGYAFCLFTFRLKRSSGKGLLKFEWGFRRWDR